MGEANYNIRTIIHRQAALQMIGALGGAAKQANSMNANPLKTPEAPYGGTPKVPNSSTNVHWIMLEQLSIANQRIAEIEKQLGID